MVSIAAYIKNTQDSRSLLLAVFPQIAGKAARTTPGRNTANTRQDAATQTALSTWYIGWSPNRKTCESRIPAERF